MVTECTLPDLGIATLDSEHRQLIALFDEFEQCFNRRAMPEKAEAVVQQALTLTNAHFAHEEKLMDETAYPRANEHKFQHRNMRLQFTTLVGDTLNHLRMHDPVTLQHLAMMRIQLQEHISGADRVLAEYVKAIHR